MSTNPEDQPTRWQWNPRLRTSRQRADGQPVVVVNEPGSGSYYQLGAEEYEIARRFDGEADLAAVLERCAAAGMPLEPSDLAQFVDQLVDTGLLVGAATPTAAGDRVPDRPVPPTLRRSLAARILQIEIAAWDPERFFARTVAWVRPLFAAPVLGASALAALAAGWVVATHAGELQEGIRALLHGVNLLALWTLYAGVVLVHELAHGYACAHYGGRVQTLGFLLLYGKPCAYCDVSDAWLLGRGQRLRVMAAGSLVELGLWAFATLAWRITAPETWANQTALLLLTLCGIGTLFNFNPLIRFDGYYMLSDGLEIPNLRQRAFADLGHRLLGRPRAPASERERRVFLWYGVVALAYSALLVGCLLWRLQSWIGARWGGLGIVLLWGGVGVAVTKPTLAAVRGFATALRAGARTRRFLWFSAGALLVAALCFVRYPLKIAAESRVEPRARVVLRSPVEGSIESVDVREGEMVRAGQPIAQLATRDLDFALASARAEFEELQAKLALLVSGPRRQEIELAQRRAEEAATRVKYARKEHERALAGLESDLVSRQSAEAVEGELRLAEEEESAARKSLELLAAGARPEELRAMQARLEAMRSQVARLEDERTRTRIVAPISGQVLTAHAERLIGRYVERGDSLLLLADLRTMLVEIPVPEKEVGDVALDAPVRFKARGLPGRTFSGRVVGIAPAAERGARQRTVLVQSELENEAGLLRPGTTGFAKVYCGDRRLGELLARRGVRMLRTEFWALW